MVTYQNIVLYHTKLSQQLTTYDTHFFADKGSVNARRLLARPGSFLVMLVVMLLSCPAYHTHQCRLVLQESCMLWPCVVV